MAREYVCDASDGDIAPAGWTVNLDALFDRKALTPAPNAYIKQDRYYPVEGTTGERWISAKDAIGG